MVRVGVVLAAVAAGVLMGGCATVARGTSEQVQFDTVPSGAEVRVVVRNAYAVSGADGAATQVEETFNTMACTSPCVLQIKRADRMAVTITKAGYETESFPVNPEASGEGVGGSVLGNALIGGVTGLVVDSVSGAMLDHCPNPVRVTLRPLPQAPVRGKPQVHLPNVPTTPFDAEVACKAQKAIKYPQPEPSASGGPV
jgi:hypothetical protein